MVKYLLILKFFNCLYVTVVWNIWFPSKDGIERCDVEQIVPDVSNDHSAFVLRFQQSNRAGKMLRVVWVMVDASIGFFLDCCTEGGGTAVLRNVGYYCLNAAASHHRRLAPSATWAARNWSLPYFCVISMELVHDLMKSLYFWSLLFVPYTDSFSDSPQYLRCKLFTVAYTTVSSCCHRVLSLRWLSFITDHSCRR